MELGQKLPIPHHVLGVVKVQLVPRGCRGVNRTGFCNMPQKNPSQPAKKNQSLCHILYVLGQGDQLSWELSHPNLLNGIQRFPHLG